MAYSKEEIENKIVDMRLTQVYFSGLSGNAKAIRDTNKKKFPNGYIYMLKLRNQNIYKIGVSQNPKRRIKDISSYSPFVVLIVGVWSFTNVYEMEEMIHDNLNKYLMRKEWFNLDFDCAIEVKEDIQHLSNNKTHLIKRNASA